MTKVYQKLIQYVHTLTRFVPAPKNNDESHDIAKLFTTHLGQGITMIFLFSEIFTFELLGLHLLHFFWPDHFSEKISLQNNETILINATPSS